MPASNSNPPPDGPPKALRLFEAYGLEVEYMLVDGESLDVAPAADQLLEAAAGELTDEFENGDVAWNNELALHVIENSEAEMADVSGDAALLRRIADASGGEFLPIERVGELPALLTAAGAGRSRFFQVSLWDSPVLFLVGKFRPGKRL